MNRPAMNGAEVAAPKKSMRVVMLVSNNIQIDARVRKEAKSLACAGYEVHVVGMGTVRPNNISDVPYSFHLSEPRFKGKKLLPRLGNEDVWRPVRVITNLTVTKYRTKKYLQTFCKTEKYCEYISKPEMQSFVEALAPDVIHAHDLDTLAPALEAAKKTGALLVYDSHELFLEQHYLDPELKSQYEELEREAFPKLDGLVTVSPAIGRLLTKKYDSNLQPVVLYNGSDATVNNVSSMGGKVKLFFQGSFAKDRNNLELIDAMVHLRGRATLTLQGWGVDKENYLNRIADLGLQDTVCVIPPCGPHEVAESAANFDVGIINSKCIDENFRNTLPNKLFDYMSAGLAIASTDLPPIKEILDKHDCGITYEQKDVEHTAKVLLELVSNPLQIEKYKENAAISAPIYSWPEQEKKLLSLYATLDRERCKRG